MEKKLVSNQFSTLLDKVGIKLKQLRIDSGYSSYEIFAWENNLSRIQYWKMEKGTNCTLKSLDRVLKIHKLTIDQFFKEVFEQL